MAADWLLEDIGDDDPPIGWSEEEYELYKDDPATWDEILEALGPEATVSNVIGYYGDMPREEILRDLKEMFPPQSDDDEDDLDDLAWKIYSVIP